MYIAIMYVLALKEPYPHIDIGLQTHFLES